MLLSRQYLLDIVATASTIDERLNEGFLPDSRQADDEIIKARFELWCQTIAKGDWEQFRQRLAWDDLSEEMVRRVLGKVRAPENMPLPAWASTLDESLSLGASLHIAETGASQTNESSLSFLDADEPLPFEELLVPFVLLAQRRYAAWAGDAYGLLSNEAHTMMQRDLLQTLTAYAAHALHLEFSIAYAQARSPLDRLLAAQDDDERQCYRQFVEHMLDGGLVSFFREYAALARLLATLTDLWVEATVEFLQRLAVDWSDIQQMFCDGREPGKVTSVAPSLSDPHRGRRRVIALTFASGHRVVYKPKDLGTEVAYQRLLSWCNAHGAPLPLRVLKVLNRGSHGWVEFVEHEACKDGEEAQRYYRRAGMLLCLIDVLEGTDCHNENIIAAAEHPVLIDMETLMHHHPRLDEEGEGALAQILAIEQVSHSVLRTGLLPNWQIASDGRSVYDISGLGSNSEQELRIRLPRWTHINTDRMALEYATTKIAINLNGPMLNDVPLQLNAYNEDLVAGFQEMYLFLLQEREALLADESPLYELAHQQVRFVYRATRIYGTLLQKLVNPRYLRDGIERSIQLEMLGRAVLPLEGPLRDRGERTRWWPVFAVERQAMLQGDVPFFTAQASSDALIVAPDQRIEACFERPGFDLVVTRLKSLDDEDLQRQLGLVRGSLYTHIARDAARTSAGDASDTETGMAVGKAISPERLVAQALAIAEQIARRAIRGPDGSAAWVAPQSLLQVERYQLQPVGYELYAGMCGIALFLAAVEKITGGAGYRELALGAVQPLGQSLLHYGRRTARDMGIGGVAGLGSVIYALTRVSQWLDAPALLEDASRAASLITVEQIADDKNLDIIAGAAGTIPGLLALYAVTADERLLDRAITCGRHLLRARTESKTGLRAWPTYDGKMLTGFSHGAAGIAYALLLLYAVTGDEDLRAAAREGIAYEDSVFLPEVGNWPDLRAQEQPACMTSWCHGAPGIALGRIGGLAQLDTDDIRGDIETAIQTTRAAGVQSVDHLCCGNLGRADILLVAADRLSRPDLAEVASQWAWQVAARAEESSAFLLNPLLPAGVYIPGFFQGTAGIGYELLRIAHPDTLPSVLLSE